MSWLPQTLAQIQNRCKRLKDDYTMTITELALLHLKSPEALSSEAVRSSLLEAKNAMQHFTGYTFYLYAQVEDPTYIYIIGCWDSLRQHFEKWIPSSTNQDLLEKLKDILEVEWMFHLDIDQSDSESAIPVDAPVLLIARHFMTPEKKHSFEKTFEEVKNIITQFTEPNLMSGGWRVDRAHGTERGNAAEEEFVLFTGWKDMSHHDEFVQTDGTRKYAQIEDLIESFDIKHATRLQL